LEAGWVKSQIEGLRLQKEREEGERRVKGAPRKSTWNLQAHTSTCTMVEKVRGHTKLTTKKEAEVKTASVDDLLSGVDPSMVAKVEDEEVNALLHAMYPSEKIKAAKTAMSDGDRSRSASRSRGGRLSRPLEKERESSRRQSFKVEDSLSRSSRRQSFKVGEETLTGEDAELAKQKMDRANRLLARAMSSGVVKTKRDGTPDNDFLQGFSSPEASFSYDMAISRSPRRSPSTSRSKNATPSRSQIGRLNTMSPDFKIGSEKTAKMLSDEELSKELEDLIAFAES